MTPSDVVLLPFPFTSLRAVKQRPCLILADFRPRGLPRHFLVAMMTSQMESIAFPGDVKVTKWREAGLPKPTLVRLAKVVTIERDLIRKVLGRLHDDDASVVGKRLRDVFAHWL